jgi:hypothetical protein
MTQRYALEGKGRAQIGKKRLCRLLCGKPLAFPGVSTFVSAI